MNTTTTYTRKAEDYHRHRWGYAPVAIQALLAEIGLVSSSSAADLGAGTGILTRHLVGAVGHVYAVEPNTGMLHFADKTLGNCPGCTILEGAAEAIPLPDDSVDLITVAHSIHWFDAEPARREMTRILKPGGWLALVHNVPTGDAGLNDALAEIMTPENGVERDSGSNARPVVPECFYFGSGGFRTIRAPFSFRQDQDGFIGALDSASFVPERDDPRYPFFERSAREAFSRFHPNGWHTVQGITEVRFGRM